MNQTWRLLLFFRRFGRANSASSAVEFAIVAMPFFFLMFAIFDVSLVYFATSTLENGIASVTRQIRTGEAQAAGLTQTQFRGMLCARIAPLLSCDSHLMIDVRRFTGFRSVSFPPALDGNGNLTGNNTFQMGSAGDVIVAKAYYSWPMLTPTGANYVDMSGHARLLTASTAFRNEPN